MCGIAGLVALTGLEPSSLDGRLDTAARRIAPRGPDAHGRWWDDHCALLHARLAVIDLSEGGAQPQRRGSLVISYNGEIYNYLEVKAELAARGHVFATESDTEVLLAGWQEWGPDVLPRLDGMFAFGLWDDAQSVFWAARDRFGEKPLSYAPTRDGLAFGSDILACEALLGETRRVDAVALQSLFSLRFVPEPLSILTGVYKLEAGGLLRLDQSGLRVDRWYRLPVPAPVERDPAALDADLRARFDRAVQARLVADVPVGVFLSGGIDSALVASAVAASGVQPKTFTVGFEGASDYYEERPLAAEVARHIGAVHTEIALQPSRVADALDGVFTGLDEPFADASAVPTFLVSQATRQSVTVVLTGDGADEVFGGYRRYWGELLAGRWNGLPGPIRAGLAGLLGRLPEGKETRLLEAVRRARRFVDTAAVDPVDRQVAWMQDVRGADLDRLLLRPPDHPYDLVSVLRDVRSAAAAGDPVTQMLACDVAVGLPSDMLVKVDRMSMAHALETRAPFLAPEVVAFAFALPGAEKLGFRGMKPEGKRILRRAFRDRLPAGVFTRPKRGFEMPVKTLLLGAARERLDRACAPEALARQGLFDPGTVARWRSDLVSGRRDTSWRLWTLLAFQEWARVHRRPEALT